MMVRTSSLRFDTRRTVANGKGGAVSARSAGEAGVNVSAPNAGSPTPLTPTPYGDASPEPKPKNGGGRTPPPVKNTHCQNRNVATHILKIMNHSVK